MMKDTNTAPGKLPLWRTVRQAFILYSCNFSDVIRITWPWIVTSALFLGFPNSPASPIAAGRVQNVGGFAIVAVSSLLLAAGAISIAVAWHRKLILDERSPLSCANLLSGPFWKYVWAGFVISIIVWIPTLASLLAVALFAAAKVIPPYVVIGVMVVAMCIMALCIQRILIVLPSRAVNDQNLTIGKSWDLTSGNTWRLFVGFLVTIAPAIVMQIVFHLLFNTSGALPERGVLVQRAIFEATLTNITGLLLFPIYIGFLSLSYAFFVKRKIPATSSD
jgi:hypothetical protein